jgi:hypothetical protein
MKRTSVLLSSSLAIIGVLGACAIAWLFPGRPRTRLTYFGPTVMMLIGVAGIVGLVVQTVTWLIRRRGA